MKYKNCGYIDRTFYGVTFKPGDIHEVPGYINAQHFIRIGKNEDVSDVVDQSESQPKRKVGRPAKSRQDEKVENNDSEKESLIKTELVQETVEDKTSKETDKEEKDKEKD